jgi:aspartate 1-decarboxylase
MHKALNSEGFFIFRVDPTIYARFDGTYVVLSESGNQSCIVYDGAGLEVDEGDEI